MPSREYYIQQAETCLKLAIAATEPVAKAQLTAMADHFQRMAYGAADDIDVVDLDAPRDNPK